MWLIRGYKKIQTHKRVKRPLFVTTTKAQPVNAVASSENRVRVDDASTAEGGAHVDDDGPRELALARLRPSHNATDAGYATAICNQQ